MCKCREVGRRVSLDGKQVPRSFERCAFGPSLHGTRVGIICLGCDAGVGADQEFLAQADDGCISRFDDALDLNSSATRFIPDKGLFELLCSMHVSGDYRFKIDVSLWTFRYEGATLSTKRETKEVERLHKGLSTFG